MNTSPRRASEEPQKSPQQELFEKLSELRKDLRSALIEITRTGVKKSVEDLEMDLLFKNFAQEFGFGKTALEENKKWEDEEERSMKKQIRALNQEITALLRIFSQNHHWSKGQESKARLLFYRVKEFVRIIQ